VLHALLLHVHSHIEDEILFVRLADSFTQDALIELADRIQSAKDKASAWPHPAVPGTRPPPSSAAPGTGSSSESVTLFHPRAEQRLSRHDRELRVCLLTQRSSW
jgi:hypothetical protein